MSACRDGRPTTTNLGNPVLYSSSLGEVGDLGPVLIGVCGRTERRAAGMCRGVYSVSGHNFVEGVRCAKLEVQWMGRRAAQLLSEWCVWEESSR